MSISKKGGTGQRTCTCIKKHSARVHKKLHSQVYTLARRYTQMMKLLSVLLTAILFIQAFVDASSVSDAVNSLPQEGVARNSGGLLTSHQYKINCNFACARRCSKTRKNYCFRACSSCCATCGCVPPGTYGNKNLCPCYANLKTHGNRSKCP